MWDFNHRRMRLWDVREGFAWGVASGAVTAQQLAMKIVTWALRTQRNWRSHIYAKGTMETLQWSILVLSAAFRFIISAFFGL